MKLTVLGSGTLFLTPKRFPSAFLLEHENKKILLDCGFGAIARLSEASIDHRDIGAILISHFHTDHFGDCFNLIHSRWVGDCYEGRKNRKIVIAGPQTIERRFKEWRRIFWPEPKEHHPVEFREGTVVFRTGGISVKTFPVFHVPWFKSVGYVIKAGGKKLVYPGDIGSEKSLSCLSEAARNADLLIIEAGYPKPTPNHFSLDRLDRIMKIANVKKALICHLKESDEIRVKEYAKTRKKCIIAEDKLNLKL
ncbi:hypothetical protein A2303_06265 [Candidatus Falkowbacteria bacterium RIFOXYB2_FULL_47_14]|uniref:Metallo-beta-lactamase domain-containing protein n=1 Tax=Candidatus Falkowbacteria bacterium RIFOXYA2_FULL_47_19 TaxID=1797994 RepID=A0A1F5SMP1_9BACT|nr:MAG: hypothetical protein A2227_05130 [Candidatus Falkowbacteria bacterium RIFOXYA2_FULL_47_19]OGF35117.1 MAG: hypothetical protein A2468_03985 [Candidatus Falkowbacteria bacterium RIFOXYC2_FULL_46_15]OGF43165.1 MAG: hypothetical protein A2303_06265 [Candidatus Falkowbacteria bacterium RIFOXYB2_FULL_47_14]